jgi:hypothetical protein
MKRLELLVELRSQHHAFRVAEGDIPDDAILHRLFNLRFDSHAVAVKIIHIMSLSMIDEVSDLSTARGGSRPRVNRPGDPSAGGLAADQVGLLHDENTVARVHRELAQGPPLNPADNVARLQL